jgi:SAM-dependent methyltransferase
MTALKALEEIYGSRFFARRHRLNWRAPIVCGAIRDTLKPVSVIDVGCATGDLVAEFATQGFDAYGLEGSRAVMPFLECEAGRVFFMDLRKPLPAHFMRDYDVALCLEVAEHIESEYAQQLVQNLGLLSGCVLMSAARPGQGGHHHVNCQSPEYWEDLFRVDAFRRVQRVEREIKQAWEPWRKKPGIKAYYQNLLYFEGRPCWPIN